MQPDQTPRIDKQQARRAFSRAAPHYDEVAALQREIAARMLDRLAYIRHEPAVVLDVGTGTGDAIQGLGKRYPNAQIIALDFALPMLHQARQREGVVTPDCLCGDAERLPLADASVEMIFSSATLQWCNDLRGTFREFLRVLRPNGMLLFSTFGPDTLMELRASWAAVDGGTHVSPFMDMHNIGDAMLEAGMAEPVVDVDRLQVTYENVPSLMRDLKTLGAHNVTRDRQRGLTGKGRLRAMYQAYEKFRRDERLPASYEVVYGHAWAPSQRQREGQTEIPLEVVRGLLPG
jgi:malonyl-CoA O-methyltransferase